MISLHKTYRFIALGMAVVILSTTGVFTVDVHYCQGHLKSLSFTGKAKACYEIAACPMHQNDSKDHEEDKKDCCHNESFLFQADHDVAYEYSKQVVVELADFSLFATLSQKTIAPLAKDHRTDYLQYRPPPLFLDLPVLFQSFLI